MNFIKLSSFVIILCFLASLYNLTFAETHSSNLNETKQSNIETNFLWLKLHEFQFSHPKSQVLLSADPDSSNIYVAARGLAEISVVSLNKSINSNLELNKLNTVKVPSSNSELENVYILDIKFFKKKLYSTIFRYSDKENSCSYVELLESDKELSKFKSIFKSKPCLNMPIGLHNISGRIAVNDSYIFLAGGNMLIDIGDTFFPKSFSEYCCPQNSYQKTMKKTNFFGSIVSVDKKTLFNKKISEGHRVPEGLFYDNSRDILWESEHGPRGGDEINLINLKKFSNYGFPFVTLGSFYWKEGNLNTKFNSHNNFTLPFFSFVPSIGPSQLSLPPQDGLFKEKWGNDILLTSLKDKSIYRIKILNKKVIYSERIFIGSRLRSVDTLLNSLIMGTDNGSILVLNPMVKKVEGAFPIGDYEYPRCAEKGNDRSCNISKPKKFNWLSRILTL